MKAPASRCTALILTLLLAACGSEETNVAPSPDMTPQPEAQPDPMPEAQPDPEPEAQPDPEPEAQPDPEPEVMPDGNDSIDEAEAITPGEAHQDTLDTLDDFDFFSFEGSAGQILIINSDAKPDDDPFRDGHVDMVLTLFDQDGNRIAENDDPIPRSTQDSRLFTVLPSDGTYFIRVADFCFWAESETGTNPCSPDYVITEPDYGLVVTVMDPGSDGVHAESEGGEVTFEENEEQASGYFLTIVAGAFEATDEVDTYAFTLPEDLSFEGRSQATFRFFPSGPQGSGGTAALADVYVTEGADPAGPRLSQVSGENITSFGMTMIVPVELGQTYHFHVTTDASELGANPSYIMLMGGTGSNPLETNEEANNDISTPDDLEEVESGENPAFFVAGDVLADDVDHFLMAIDGIDAERKISCSCSSARVGSGVQGLRLSIVDVAGDGELVSGTEADDANANCGEDGIDIPEGATELVLKIEGGGQSETVTGTHYRCGVNFFSAE